MKKRLFFLLAAVLVAMTTFSASALTLNPFKRAGRVKHENLIIGGNYTNTRILIELAQYYTKQPAILFTTEPDGSTRLHLMPAEERAAQAEEIEKFQKMVEFFNPVRIIILGAQDETLSKLLDDVRDRYQVIVLESSNWSNNAASLADLLGADRIRVEYERVSKELYRFEEAKRARR